MMKYKIQIPLIICWILSSISLFCVVDFEHNYRVQGDMNYPPYEFINEDGIPDGFNFELFENIARVTGLKYHIELGPWSEVRNNLVSGETDILMGMYFSESRDEVVDFSNPHSIVYHSIFSRKENKITEIEELSDKAVLIQQGDIMHDFLIDKGITDKIIPVPNQRVALRLLSRGNFDAALLARLQGNYFINTLGYKNIEISDVSIISQRYCFAVSKNNHELVHILNEGLSILINDGTYRKLQEKWFGLYEKDNPSNRDRILLIAIALIFLTATIIVIFLRKERLKMTINLANEKIKTKLVESKLKFRDDMFRIIVENSSDFIYQINLEDMSFQYVSPSSEIVTGYTPKYFYENKSFLHTICQPEFTSYLKNLYNLFQLLDPPEDCIFAIIDPSGNKRWIKQKNQLVYQGEKPVAILCNAKDFSQERLEKTNLLDSLDHWQTTFNAINNGICVINSAGIILNCNQKFCKMSDMDKDVVINKYLAELPFLPKIEIVDFLTSGLKQLKRFSKEITINNKWYYLTLYPAYKEDKFLGYFVFIIDDITEARHSEIQLKLIHSSLDNSTEEAYWIDSSGRIKYLNSAASRNLDYKKQDLINEFYFKINKNLNKKKWENFWQLLKKEKHIFEKSRFFKRNRSTYPVEIYNNYFEFQGDEYNFVFCHNATEKENREIQMRSLFEALDNSLNGFVVIDNHYNIIYANHAFFKIFGYTNIQELASNSITDIALSTDKLDRLTAKLEFKDKVDIVSKEIRKDGQEIDCSFSFFSYRSSSEEKYTACSIIDVSDTMRTESKIKDYYYKLEQEFEQKKVEIESKSKELSETQKALTYLVEDVNIISENLRKSNKKLSYANEELESFTYTVSHDLRAPLRAINGFTNILLSDHSDMLDKKAIRLLNILNSSAIKLTTLINELLKFSRVERYQIKRNPVDLHMMITELAREVEVQYQDKNIDFSISDLPFVSGDFGLLKQVFTNLLDNAVKFSQKQENIVIKIDHEMPDVDSIVISIKDNGIGLNMKYKDKIFDVFQRLNREEEFEGTGAGLSIVKRIIMRHGGKIWVESQLGEGSTFFIQVPLQKTKN